jgi:hypothetical protein
MLLEVNPQKGFLFEGLSRRNVGQQLIAERLECTHFFCLKLVREINHAETTLAQCAINFIMATNDISLLVEIAFYWRRHVLSCHARLSLDVLWLLLLPEQIAEEIFHNFRLIDDFVYTLLRLSPDDNNLEVSSVGDGTTRVIQRQRRSSLAKLIPGDR